MCHNPLSYRLSHSGQFWYQAHLWTIWFKILKNAYQILRDIFWDCEMKPDIKLSLSDSCHIPKDDSFIAFRIERVSNFDVQDRTINQWGICKLVRESESHYSPRVYLSDPDSQRFRALYSGESEVILCSLDTCLVKVIMVVDPDCLVIKLNKEPIVWLQRSLRVLIIKNNIYRKL